jgi:hypothetical protein
MIDDAYDQVSPKHFENLPCWPVFDVFNKTIDGLIPSTRLESWEDFNAVVKNYLKDDGEEFVFRGQQNYRWFLESTLDRFSDGAIDESVAERQLRNFRLSIRGRLKSNSIVHEDAEELWAIGQHHGLATPLLDWTAAPYVALFFAFMHEDPESWVDANGDSTNHSRSIFILNKTFIEDLKDPELNGYPRIVEPAKDDHGRLVNQAGLFTISPYGETLESSLLKALVDSGVDIEDSDALAKYICKVHIENSSIIRRSCLKQLRKMNIHYGSIFPDIIGASGYCNELIKEHISLLRADESSVEVARDSGFEVRPSHGLRYSGALASILSELSLVEALFVTDEIKNKVTDSTVKALMKLVYDFVENQAGVDWYDRDSQKSRLRTIIRRALREMSFDDNYIGEVAKSLTEAAARLSRAADKKVQANIDSDSAPAAEAL